MWSGFFLGLLLISLALFIVLYLTKKQEIEELKSGLEEVQDEEQRVFDFLHGLGEAFSSELDQEKLYSLLVSGANRVLNAHGGALYLVDKKKTHLTAAFISDGCPPLIPLPRHILDQASFSTPIAIESYLRKRTIAPGEGLLGKVWESGIARLLPENAEDESLNFISNPSLKSESVMIAPLIYGGQTLGVFALANGSMGMREVFSNSDFEVFKAIVGQAAFALYSAFVYAEIGEKKRIDRDLNMAQDIQEILLPRKSPEIPGYDIAGTTVPAQFVSGDYYDYIHIDATHLGIVIADVSGKGVPASLIMTMCRTVLRSHATGNHSPASVLDKVNRQLYPDMKEDMFISLAYVVLDLETHQMTLCRAGHNAPMLYRAATQTVELLNPKGMAIGIDSGDVFTRVTGDFSVNLEQGDSLLLYTDGVTEAINRKEIEFGMDRAIQSFQTSTNLGASGIIHRLTEDLRSFVGNQPQFDDVTLVAICKL